MLPDRAGLWALALALLCSVCYLNALNTPFLLDDPINIAKNPTIQQPLSLAALVRNPRAVVTASLRINYASSALSVASYHMLNLGAHIVVGWLLFALAYVTLRLPVFRDRFTAAAEPLAAIIAAVFLLHPVQTESVTYVIQRAEIFVGASLAAALLLFIDVDARKRQPLLLTLLTAACLFGAYSKPSFAIAPALLLVYDLCFLSRGDLREMKNRWPAYAITVAVALWTFSLSRSTGSFEQNTAGFSIEGVDPMLYLRSQFGVAVMYLKVVLWPVNLCFDCGYKGPWTVLSSPLADSFAVPAAILGLLTVAALALWRSYPLLTFAVLASAGVLAPTSLVPLADFYVEHRMYFPIALIALALVPAAYEGSRALASRLGLSAAALLGLRRGLVAGVLTVLALLTVARNQVYADPLALMLDTLSKAPQNERVQYNLANEYKRRGEQDKAIERYREAIRIAPKISRSYMNLGGIYLDQGKFEEAREIYLAGSQNVPGVAMTHRNLAVACLRLARYDEALAAAERSLTIDANNVNGHNLRGEALARLGRRDEAVAEYETSLKLQPGNAAAKGGLTQLQGGN